MAKLSRIIVAVALTLVFGGIGALIVYYSDPSWYNSLNLPSITAPSWVFAPVWIIIYVLLGLALERMWDHEREQVRQRWLCQYFAQFVFNILWALLFFGIHSLLFSWINCLFLFLSVLILFIDAYEQDRPSGYYVAPYLAWVTYAGILNFWIWWIN